MFVALLTLSLSTLMTQAQGRASLVQAPPLEVRSTSLQGEVFRASGGAVVAVPSIVDTQAGQTAARLPGVAVRQYAGPGSATTASAPGMIRAGDTEIAVEGIPLPDPLGTGVDFSLFPSAVLQAVESGRGQIGLRLLSLEGPVTARPWSFAMSAGAGPSGAASFGYRSLAGPTRWGAVVTAHGTDGRYRFKHPDTGIIGYREKNDSRGTSALTQQQGRFGREGQWQAFQLVSAVRRTKPGMLSFPDGEAETDFNALAGARAHDPTFFGAHLGGTAAASISWATYPDTRVRGLYGLTQVHHGETASRAGRVTFGLEDRYADLKQFSERTSRNRFAATVATEKMLGDFRLVPETRFEHATAFGWSADGSLRAGYRLGKDHELSLQYGYLHAYPDLPYVTGFASSDFTIVSNPNLKVERSHWLSLEHELRFWEITIHGTGYFRRVRNRAVLEPLDGDWSRSQARNVSQAYLTGWMQELTWNPASSWRVQSWVQLTKSHDFATSLALPYQPWLRASMSVGWRPTRTLELTVEERFTGRSSANQAGTRQVGGYAETDIAAAMKLRHGTAWLRLTNLFEASGYVTDGYPLLGRGIWLGLQL